LNHLSGLEKHKGFEYLTEVCEDMIGNLLNGILDGTNSGIEDLIKREGQIGEVRGIKRVFSLIKSKREELQYSIADLMSEPSEDNEND